MFPQLRTSQGEVRGDLPPVAFHNTLSGETEVFVPLMEGVVKMYNCGPTVYSKQHIGNLRSYVFADTLYRLLSYWGYSVKQVINITDVGHTVADADEGEDKMEMAARTTGKGTQEIAKEYTDLWFADLDALGIDRSHIIFSPATEYIQEQIVLIQTLEEKGYTYRGKKGVYFDTARFPGYGKLGNIALEGLQEGARVEADPEKHSPHDFFLWKFAESGVKREQEWESPWGVGFPGWHIECTAMIFRLLGKQIDIHTGGIDHIPVHHNNEIAQAEAASGKKYVNYWMHNAHAMVDGKKISKSLGNSVYLSDLADKGISPLALRYWYLTAHYRTQVNFTWEAVEGAAAALGRLKKMMAEWAAATENAPDAAVPDPTFMRDFLEIIAYDVDTPKALALVWVFVKNDAVSGAVKYATLLEADKLLGLDLAGAQKEIIKAPLTSTSHELPVAVRALIVQRDAARTNGDFARSDELRKEIAQHGYIVTDTPGGSQLSKA